MAIFNFDPRHGKACRSDMTNPFVSRRLRQVSWLQLNAFRRLHLYLSAGVGPFRAEAAPGNWPSDRQAAG